MLVQPPGAPDERHLRVRFRARRRPGSSSRFVDQRMFGGLSVSEGGAELPAEIAHIARDPLDPGSTTTRSYAGCGAAQDRDQAAAAGPDVVSGVGNIYADEALWRARLHGERPTRPAAPRRRAAGCWPACREVMLEALGQGGTSFDALYVNVNGRAGYFDRSLDVYGREGEPCPRCGTPIRRSTFMNRSSYFCPVCQPAPAPAHARPRAGLPARA